MTNVKNIKELLKSYANIMDELKEKSVIRTLNNPVGDYAEWLTAKKLHLTLAKNSEPGYDATDCKTKKRFQVKSRRLTSHKQSRQMGVIRNIKKRDFDYLIGILFNRDFTIKEAYKIPRSVIKKYSKFSEHQNGHIFHLRGDLLSDPKTKNITNILN